MTCLADFVTSLTLERTRCGHSNSRSLRPCSPAPRFSTIPRATYVLVPQKVRRRSQEVLSFLQLGELLRWSLAPTSVSGHSYSCLVNVSDEHSNTRFLVDTDSEESVIPPTTSDHQHSPDPLTLTAINNTTIHTYGKCFLTQPQTIATLDIHHRQCQETNPRC